MPEREQIRINKTPHRPILSDVVVPKRMVAAEQMFRPPQPRLKSSPRLLKKYWKWIFCAFVVLGAYGAWSISSSRMEVTISPRVATRMINKTFSLTSDPKDTAKLFLRTFVVSNTHENTFEGRINLAPVEKRAHGTVVIFNKTSTIPQTLVATTRLQTADGKLYRLPTTVAVPGYRIENKEIIPGSRAVEVFADKPGEEYNIGLTDFTFPGFAGSPKFATVFARSKTPMEGGFRGEARTVNSTDVGKAFIALKAEGEAAAQGYLQSKLPPDALLLKQSIEYRIIDQQVVPLAAVAERDKDRFKLTLKEEVRGAIIDIQQLSRLFGETTIPQPIKVTKPESLNYELADYRYDMPQGSLRVHGEVLLESVLPMDAIKNHIIEKKEKKSAEILRSFPALATVEVRFYPFWWQSLSRIDIKLKTR